jgi:NitT/TauT family transport system ATP-binding protein
MGVTDPVSVELRQATKTFDSGVSAVGGVSLEVKAGEFVSIVGPSGCGKSTILRLVAGLLPVTTGSVVLNGTEVTGPRQDIGMMFQRPTLLPWKTALENALLPATFKSASRRRQPEARELLKLVGLAGFEHSYPRHLSGGMQQRVALARLLMIGADVLLLDEPFAAVDELTRDRLNVELLRIHERTGATVILVTHNLNEAALLADRVIVMTPRPGVISEEIPVPFERPRDPRIVTTPAFQEIVYRARERLESDRRGGASEEEVA